MWKCETPKIAYKGNRFNLVSRKKARTCNAVTQSTFMFRKLENEK